MRPGLLLGDFDLRQGSFHSSGLLGMGIISFLGGGSIGPLGRKEKKGFLLLDWHLTHFHLDTSLENFLSSSFHSHKKTNMCTCFITKTKCLH